MKVNMSKNSQPLAEVFGHLPVDFSSRADRFRNRKLCPFNNKVPNCTKDKAKDPLGVCSINYRGVPVITCPVRFREDWLITEGAADFFFPKDTSWSSLTEVKLRDYYGKSAGNIDVVLVAYDDQGKVCDFGSLEIQAVYISGNVRDPFKYYMSDCKANAKMDWTSESKYPRPDFLSSSRKRLVPQLLFKGEIFHQWKKKMAVALDKSFFETLPELKEVDRDEAEIAWLVYDLELNSKNTCYTLVHNKTVYTKFMDSINAIARPRVGDMSKFMSYLQTKVDKKLELPPLNETIENLIGD